MSDGNNGVFRGMLAIAIAVIITGVIGRFALNEFKRANDTITVTGSATKPIDSDFIIWSGVVSSRHASRQQAYAEVEQSTKRLHEYLLAHGLPDSMIVFGSFYTNEIPEFGPNHTPTGKIAAYEMRQEFEVQSYDVDGIAALAREATELINEGIALQSYPPQYIFTGLDELRVEMLELASRDARDRAVAIARSVGSEIGAVRSVRMGVFQITPRHSTAISDYGINDTSSREKEITGVVRVTFAVE